MRTIVLTIGVVLLSTPLSLYAQTASLTKELTQTGNICVDLQYNMVYRSHDGKTNGEVSKLQSFLNTNGYLSFLPTGFFGPATLSAVKNFQSGIHIGNQGTPGYGGVGPKTRLNIKEITCASASTTTSSVPGCLPGYRFSRTTGKTCTVTQTSTLPPTPIDTLVVDTTPPTPLEVWIPTPLSTNPLSPNPPLATIPPTPVDPNAIPPFTLESLYLKQPTCDLTRYGSRTPVMTAPVIYVRDFGAVGDGKTDDSDAINRAIRSLSAGGTVVFDPGKTYLKRKLITVRNPGVKLWAKPSAGRSSRHLARPASPSCSMTMSLNTSARRRKLRASAIKRSSTPSCARRLSVRARQSRKPSH